MNFRALIQTERANNDPIFLVFEGFDAITNAEEASALAAKIVEARNGLSSPDNQIRIVYVEMEDEHGFANSEWPIQGYVRSEISITRQSRNPQLVTA